MSLTNPFDDFDDGQSAIYALPIPQPAPPKQKGRRKNFDNYLQDDLPKSDDDSDKDEDLEANRRGARPKRSRHHKKRKFHKPKARSKKRSRGGSGSRLGTQGWVIIALLFAIAMIAIIITSKDKALKKVRCS